MVEYKVIIFLRITYVRYIYFSSYSFDVIYLRDPDRLVSAKSFFFFSNVQIKGVAGRFRTSPAPLNIYVTAPKLLLNVSVLEVVPLAGIPAGIPQTSEGQSPRESFIQTQSNGTQSDIWISPGVCNIDHKRYAGLGTVDNMDRTWHRRVFPFSSFAMGRSPRCSPSAFFMYAPVWFKNFSKYSEV